MDRDRRQSGLEEPVIEVELEDEAHHDGEPFPVPRSASGIPVREDDLEPHAGLRYIARLFKLLAALLVILLIAELIVGFMQEGRAAATFLMIEATRLIVFAGFLWGAGDIALMLIESNHDLRATRILLARLLGRVEAVEGDLRLRRGSQGSMREEE
ncbi:MAG: hypothetical protein ACRELD_05305 [Longimicrobiales bacterium]